MAASHFSRNNLLVPYRPRNRSSLDTFLIPHRTRIPSRNPQPFDVQVAQSLLKSSMDALPRDPPPYIEHVERRSDSQRTSSASPTGGECTHDVRCEAGESLYRLSPPTSRPVPPRTGSQDGLIIPHRRPHLAGRAACSQAPNHKPTTFDGPQDSSCESRVTSTTYSMVSRRIVTDSSGSSRAYAGSRFSDDYNHLAAKHGLPEIDLGHGDIDEKPSTNIKTKEHKNGWLKRKFFHHSSTSFTYKARTTYRSVPRKKSFGTIPSLTDGGHKDILDGKTLEETCRLGGLGVLILPTEYAMDKLTLPTCISAAATYLLKYGMLVSSVQSRLLINSLAGVNAPGLFRVSGQTATVNALYDHFAHQFYQAGSPSKVQETVKPGLLPADIEFSVSDVASLFKKVLNAFPGGLLGSLELFEAIRAVLLKLEPDPDLSEAEMTGLKAKLIALAILSVTSSHRVFLIQGVLGLVAHFAYEAENAHETLNDECNASDGPQRRKPSSELMGYQSLGVCLGPLLVGDLIDRVLVEGESAESEPRSSTESTKKAKKKRVSLAVNKLEKDSHLAAHVDRANLTASIMQRLLMIWKDVVTQLRFIHGASKPSKKPSKESPVHKLGGRNSSRLTLKSTDEERVFLELLRGRSLPDELPNGAQVKEKMKFKSNCGSPRIMIKALDHSQPDRPWFPRKGDFWDGLKRQEQANNKPRGKNARQHVEQHSLDDDSKQPHAASEGTGTSERQLCSDVGIHRMTMGQILPPDNTSRHSSGSSKHRHYTMAAQNPTSGKTRSSSDVTQETASRELSGLDGRFLSRKPSPSRSLEKPLPPLKGGLPPPPVRDSPKRKQSFPIRQSSLPRDRQTSIRPEPAPGISTDSEAGDKPQSQGSLAFTSIEPGRDGIVTRRAPEVSGGGIFGGLRATFSEREKVARKGKAKDKYTVIPAYINPLPMTQSPLGDPFATSASSSPAKDTLIPKPVHEAGRGRKAESRSPSPTKTALPPVKASAGSQTGDQDAETVRRNTVVPTGTSSSVQRVETGSGLPAMEVVPTRPLSVYTADALRRRKSVAEEPPTAQHIAPRVISFESPLRPNSMLDLSPASLTALKRSGSNNATLYAEITRLKRQLEQKNEEFQATRRSLDAARATKEGGCEDGAANRGSWNKGTLSAEIREAKREAQNWKKRAEWAEKRLAGLGSLAVDLGNARHQQARKWHADADAEAEAEPFMDEAARDWIRIEANVPSE
ncbi:MAG: hypothetical protein Q9163_004417 [Psora crenata]